ncbi:Histone-lysine N-methyltransferase CLF [Camellia lanceoleosa]|uniref:Histone-lysine N-methyltransferase CLF n=1 Tax=Camellia lanceoleosa TaxID=1840588 RepID=A0ACC0HXW3_9ERIC|nr:Histone-lysine N-methyltransferase CLF [Camellia lanceoleosa]
MYEVLSKGENSVEGPGNSFLDKDLEAALDSFDSLFCRRCLAAWMFLGSCLSKTERLKAMESSMESDSE